MGVRRGERNGAVSHDVDVCLIDLSSIFFGCWHATVNESVSEARNLTLTGVRRAAEGAKYVAICTDEGRSWRKSEYPEYKANRPEKDAAALEELRKTKERLRQDGYLLWGAEGLEADDVIATACQAAQRKGLTVRIASADKDLLQLVNRDCFQLSTKSWQVLGEEAVKAKFGVRPGQMRDYLALVGDSSDNIPGVKGVGAKTAAAMLEKFGDLASILTALDTDPESVAKPAVRESFKNGGLAALHLSHKLIGLRFDAPIAFDDIYGERTPEPLVERSEDVSELDGQADNEIDEAPQIVDTRTSQQRQAEAPPPETPPASGNGGGNGHAGQVTAIALRPVSFELQLEPTSLGTAYKLATGLYNSRLYQRFSTPEAIWAVIIRGREMGIGALTALDCFEVVEGKPFPKAHLIIARAKAHPDCEYFQFLGGDDTYAEYETKNRCNPKPTKFRYTIDMAKLAGRVAPSRKTGEPNQWMKMPAELLRKTCGVQLARLEYPDAGLGLIAYEEADDAA